MSMFLEYTTPVTLMFQPGLHCIIVLLTLDGRGAEHFQFTMATKIPSGSNTNNCRKR